MPRRRGKPADVDTPDQRQLQPVPAASSGTPQQLAVTKIERTLANQHVRGGIVKALAGRVDPDQFIGVTLALLKDPSSKLHQCPLVTILSAIIQGAQMGLSFQRFLGEVWLIPRRNKHTRRTEANCQMGYKGVLKLMSRSPMLGAVRCGVACEHDAFDFQDGSDPWLRHKVCIDGPRGNVRAAWALAEYKGGGFVFSLATLQDLDAAQAMGGPVWKSHYQAMCRKTALLRLGNLVPLDDRDKVSISQDALSEATGESVVDTDVVDDLLDGVEPEQNGAPTLDSLADEHEHEAPSSEKSS